MTEFDGASTSSSKSQIPEVDSSNRPLLAVDQTVLLESSPDAVAIINADGAITVVNRHAEKMFGYARGELLGQPVEVLVPSRLRDRHVGHRSGYVSSPAPRPMGSGLELLGRRKDGSEFPVEISLSPLPAGEDTFFFAAIRDVTSRVAAEAESFAIRGSIDAAHDALFMIDPETLKFSYANQGAVNQLGFDRDELLTMSAADVAPEYSPDDIRTLLAPLFTGDDNHPEKSISVTTVYRRKCGTDIPVDIVFNYPEAPRSDIDRHVVALARDISDRRKIELERDKGVRWLQSLAALRSSLMSDPPLHEVLTLVCHQARELTGSDLAAICEPAAGSTVDTATDRSLLRFRYFDSIESEAEIASKQLVSTDMIELALGGAPVVVANTDQGAGIGPENHELGSQFDHLMMVPIEGVDQVAGLLLVGRSGTDRFADDEVSIAASLAAEAHNAYSLTDARRTKIQVKILEDRERLAQDLHDLVIQRIFAAGLRLQSVQGLAEEGVVRDRLGDTIVQLDETIAELRNAIFRLNTPSAPATDRIESVVGNAAAQMGFRPTLRFSGPVNDVPPGVLGQLEPALSEALANVHRHAQATKAHVTVAVDDGTLELTVSDDGQGFDPSSPRGDGINNLESRAAKLGGTCSVTANPDGGTTVRWTASF